MKARFLALAALVLGLASCQTEPEGLNVNVGGEVDTTITVSLPEATRAADSAEGAFKNLVDSDKYTIRYIFQVFYNDDESKAARQVIYSDGNTVSFPVRLVPGRDYNFVAWADVVPQTGKTLDVLGEYNKESDYRYNTEDLKAVTFKGDWLAMDETFDAYTDAQTIKYYGTTGITLNLTRPFAKLRVMTTDMVELDNLQIVPEGVTVEYTVPVYKSFDVTAQAAKTDGASTHTFTYNLSEVQEYTATETTSTLFTNYLFGAENGIVKFTMDVTDNTSAAERIKYNNFNTDIPVQRNYLTTISGNILTDGNNVKVDIVEDGAFAGEKEWPEKGDSAQELAYAAMFGGEVTLTENITLTQPLTIVKGANVVINLDGKTITGNWHKDNGAVIKNNGTLTIVGGTISSTGENGGSAVQNNGTLTIKNATLNGAPNANGSWPSYTVNNTGTMTLENTTITSYHGAVASYGDGAVVTLNNCTIDMAGIPGFTSHGIYTYNSGKVIVNGGTYENKATDQVASGASVINGAVEVNAGSFSGRIENYYGTPVLKGGTFKTDPKNYLAEGYKAIETSEKMYVVVAKNVNGYLDSVITNQDGARYEGGVFESGYMENALWFNNYVFGGNAAIVVENKTYNAIVIENCSGEFKNDVITINNTNNSVMCLVNLNFTLAEGKKLIKSTNKIHQVFMENITINGEKMTQDTIGKYLENVEWYQVVEEI